MSVAGVIRGAIFNPRADGTIEFFADGVLLTDEQGKLLAIGPWADVSTNWKVVPQRAPPTSDLIVPPLLDAHIHIPQHPIRGQFTAGVDSRNPSGRLLAGLERNVFPAEGRCSDVAYARTQIEAFRADTLSQGVVGGAAYMTVHPAAARAALEMLPDSWSVGLVLMNRYCPEYLRSNVAALAADIESLARDFASRLIVTDRFAVSVDGELRRAGVALAERFGLRMQTHLNEQLAEKRLVEQTLYPDAPSYTDVYRRDGLLARQPLLAHCIHQRSDEWDTLAAAGVTVCHCPVSNTLLGSGIMPLAELRQRRIPYTICTDVGASPTTSLLVEMSQFLRVHADSAEPPTPTEALWHVTRAPAVTLGLDDQLGSFEVGRPVSFIQIATSGVRNGKDANATLRDALFSDPDAPALADAEPAAQAASYDRLRQGEPNDDDLAIFESEVRRNCALLNNRVASVTLRGQRVWDRMPRAD